MLFIFAIILFIVGLIFFGLLPAVLFAGSTYLLMNQMSNGPNSKRNGY